MPAESRAKGLEVGLPLQSLYKCYLIQAFNSHALPDSDSGPVCAGMHRGGHREEDRRDRTGGGMNEE